jgi:signal transduction histidine kinase
MKNSSARRRVAAAVVVLGLWWAAPCGGQGRENVLLVYQEHATLPGILVMESALAGTLRQQAGPGVQLFEEQIDASRFPEESAARLADIRARYAKRKVDAVIYAGTTPVEILAGVPTVYISNLSDEAENFAAFRAPVDAVWYGVDPVKIVAAARKLEPKTNRVLLVAGAAPGDQFYLNQFRSRLKSLESQIQVESAGNDTLEQLVSRVSHLPRETIVIFITYSRDPAGRLYIPREVAGTLAQASTAPVYGVSDTYIGTGIVGGYVISWAKTGAAAANVALALMHGKSPGAVAPESTSDYVFDWRQLQRWGFKESDLPAGSLVEFKTLSVWELYRWRIVGAAALIVAQSLLIAGLLIQKRRRQRAEDSLREMAGRLLQTQDEERRRLARELHDGTGQHLSGIALGVGQVLRDFPEGHEPLKHLLQDSYTASRQALAEVRGMSYALHPPILDGLQKRTNLRIDFEAPEELTDVTPDAQQALFRVVQESVTNVLRHSGGNAIVVRLVEANKGVTLELEDNGRGMNARELEQAKGAASLGVGIAGMRERVQQLNGTFEINSGLRGTRVSVSLPQREGRYVADPAG